MRKNKLLIMIGILVLAVAVAATVILREDHPTDSEKKEIETAWRKEYRQGFAGWYGPNNPYGVHHYGEYDGCHILFHDGDLTVYSEVVIAGETFKFPSSHIFCAYRDGEITDVPTAFENGWIDADDVAQIAKIHRKTLEN